MTKTYTSNGSDTGTGVFTGYNITVNVPAIVPVCDRVKINAINYLLKNFVYVSSNTNVTIPKEY